MPGTLLSWILALLLSALHSVQGGPQTPAWYEPLVYQDEAVSQPLETPTTAVLVEAAEVSPPRPIYAAFSESEMRSVLAEAGWPAGRLTEEALAVSYCESQWRWWVAGDSGRSVSLFQMGVARPGWLGWFIHFGVDESMAFDPVTNSRVALMARLERGRWGGFGGWSCADLLGIY